MRVGGCGVRWLWGLVTGHRSNLGAHVVKVITSRQVLLCWYGMGGGGGGGQFVRDTQL